MTTDGSLLREAAQGLREQLGAARRIGSVAVAMRLPAGDLLAAWLDSAAEDAEQVGADYRAIRFAAALIGQPEFADEVARPAEGKRLAAPPIHEGRR